MRTISLNCSKSEEETLLLFGGLRIEYVGESINEYQHFQKNIKWFETHGYFTKDYDDFPFVHQTYKRQVRTKELDVYDLELFMLFYPICEKHLKMLVRRAVVVAKTDKRLTIIRNNFKVHFDNLKSVKLKILDKL
jgi:hypothetical protein